MDLYEQLNKRFPITMKIVKCYDYLINLIESDNSSIEEFIQMVDKIKELKYEEYQLYNKFTFEEINGYVSKLSRSFCQEMKFTDIRINGRLICTYDRMRGYSINCNEIFTDIDVNMELSITDIVNSKINIDTYKLISYKLNNLVCTNDLDIMYKNNLIQLNMRNYIYKMTFKETSELLMIYSMFNIHNVLEIDLNVVEKKYFNKTGKKIHIKQIVESNIYSLTIKFLDDLLCSKIDGNDIDSIYYNLFMISHLEILLDYLSIDKLNDLSLYYGRMIGQDKMIVSSVKDLIKRKVKENNSN